MTLSDIKELLRIIAESGVEEVEVEQDGLKLVVRRHAPTFTVQQSPTYAPPFPPAYAPPSYPPMQGYGYPPQHAQPHAAPAPEPAHVVASVAAPAAAPAPAPPATGETVRAPIVGTFYRSPSPDAALFVEVGDRIAKGQILCIIEAMKLMNEVESDVAGTLRQVLVENAQPVEYDQPLFIVEPD